VVTTDEIRPRLASRVLQRYLNVPSRMLPILALSFLSSFTLALRVDFVGIWALDHVGAVAAALGIAYLVNAVLEAPSSVVAGWLVSVRSRRAVYVGSALANAVVPALFIAVDGHALAALVVMTIAGATDSFGWVALSVSIADETDEADLDAAYSAQRVVGAAGLAAGPLLAGLLLLVGWDALWTGACLCGLFTAAVAVRVMPSPRPGGIRKDDAKRPSWRFLRDRVFLGLYAAGAIAYLVLFAYEIVFPIAFTADGLISPARLAFIIGLNPALVIVLQTALTRAVAAWPPRTTLVVGPLAMALPALLLLVDRSLWTIVLVLALGAVGEMIWSPASSAVAARLAPPDARGPYIGTLATTYSFGIALAPLAGLTARDQLGSAALFAAVGLAGACSAVLYAVVARSPRDPDSVEVTAT
jgi:predicted MFS family arabinose efflux permease